MDQFFYLRNNSVSSQWRVIDKNLTGRFRTIYKSHVEDVFKKNRICKVLNFSTLLRFQRLLLSRTYAYYNCGFIEKFKVVREVE